MPRDSAVGLTAAEINRATTRLAHLKDGIIDISQATQGTTMLLAIQELMRNDGHGYQFPKLGLRA